jgi:hypothetical protein
MMSDEMGWRQFMHEGHMVLGVKVHCANPEGFHDRLMPLEVGMINGVSRAVDFVSVWCLSKWGIEPELTKFCDRAPLSLTEMAEMMDAYVQYLKNERAKV